MIAFWIREIVGWLLVLAGLYLLLLCVGFVSDRMVIEGGILAFVGVMVFRGGIHLIKVATAARVVLRSYRPSAPDRVPPATRAGFPSRLSP